MPAYIVFIRDKTTDAAEMKTYSGLAPATMAGHEVTPLVAYGAYEVLEGSPVEGAVILKFPTMAAAKAWYDSQPYQDAAKHRHAGSDYRVVIFDGLG